jgi:hypothetical protein
MLVITMRHRGTLRAIYHDGISSRRQNATGGIASLLAKSPIINLTGK